MCIDASLERYRFDDAHKIHLNSIFFFNSDLEQPYVACIHFCVYFVYFLCAFFYSFSNYFSYSLFILFYTLVVVVVRRRRRLLLFGGDCCGISTACYVFSPFYVLPNLIFFDIFCIRPIHDDALRSIDDDDAVDSTILVTVVAVAIVVVVVRMRSLRFDSNNNLCTMMPLFVATAATIVDT